MHKNNFRLLKSALIQIIDNEKSISGENEVGDMTKDKIKKLLEKELFQNIKTIEETQEYVDMFDNTKVLLEEKRAEIDRENRKAIIEKDIQPYLKFTKEVAKYLESKNYREGKDYNLLKDEDIINKMADYDYPQHIRFNNINNIFVWLESNYENDCILYYFGICTEDENIINQINKKQLKTSIENIFSDFNYTEENWWIFRSYIDIEKDKPQKIAQAMIDLYELLKKEIK